MKADVRVGKQLVGTDDALQKKNKNIIMSIIHVLIINFVTAC